MTENPFDSLDDEPTIKIPRAHDLIWEGRTLTISPGVSRDEWIAQQAELIAANAIKVCAYQVVRHWDFEPPVSTQIDLFDRAAKDGVAWADGSLFSDFASACWIEFIRLGREQSGATQSPFVRCS